MRSSGFFILVVLFFSQGFDLNAQTASTDLFFVCHRQKEVRWLRTYKTENGKCKSLYSKEGYLQVISSASSFTYCETNMTAVKKNLEEGGFNCEAQSLAALVEIE